MSMAKMSFLNKKEQPIMRLLLGFAYCPNLIVKSELLAKSINGLFITLTGERYATIVSFRCINTSALISTL